LHLGLFRLGEFVGANQDASPWKNGLTVPLLRLSLKLRDSRIRESRKNFSDNSRFHCFERCRDDAENTAFPFRHS